MPPVVAEVGSTANNYQILAKLATGGMAEIFLARGASTAGVERYVVLKRIIRDKAHDDHFVQMFLEEARLAAQLQHANIAQVFDIGKLGDSFFFTMEYVHGETVRGLLQRARSLRREIPLGIILTVIAGTAAGLHHAHDRIGIDGRALGIVHRDVSPSNLMISYDGSIKVVDFGVAKAQNRAQETRSGAVKGKISYLSPEQCRGAPVDRRSDLFSLGIVLWEMLTTERLYRRNSDFENMTAIVNEATPPPSRHRPGLPWELEQLSMRLLSKIPEERFQTADELVQRIEELAARNHIALSVSAVGRFMKELFGQRPEPWVELETRDAAEGVTVTSEPILSVSIDPIEGQLAHVRDLSMQYAAQLGPASESRPPTNLPGSQLMTAQAMPAIPDEPPTLIKPDMFATIPMYRQPGQGGPAQAQRPTTLPNVAPPPPGSSPPSYSGTGSVSALPYPVLPGARPSRTNVGLIAAVAATVVGVAVVVFLLVRSGREDHATTNTLAPTTVREDAAAAATVAVAPDAAIAVAVAVAPDAAAVAVAPDAAIAVADLSPDAGAVLGSTARDQILAATTERQYAEALKLCDAGAGAAELAVPCARVACAAGDSVRGKAWIARAPSDARGELNALCKFVTKKPPKPPKPPRPPGTTPPPDGPKPDPCKTDPMACQH